MKTLHRASTPIRCHDTRDMDYQTLVDLGTAHALEQARNRQGIPTFSDHRTFRLEKGRGTPPARSRRHLLWEVLAIVVFSVGLTAYLWWAYAPMAALPNY